MITKAVYQSFGPRHDREAVSRLFFARWGYRPQEILEVGHALAAGPLTLEDAALVRVTGLTRVLVRECSTAKRA